MMLILRVNPHEFVQAGNCKVYNTESFAVRIGFDAPRDVVIVREKLIPDARADEKRRELLGRKS